MEFPSHDFLSSAYLSTRFTVAQAPASRLKWHENPRAAAKAAAGITLKNFSNYLKSASILDNTTINMQGSTVWLPYGMKLRKIFDQVISDIYESYKIDPYYYPSLVPTEIFEPLDGLYSLKNRILCVGTEDEIEKGKYRAVLSPTGEATIYHHWMKYIKHQPLPLRMYRNASYFRPVSQQAGMGIFNAAEATGVFEFHAAYKERSEIESEINNYYAMLEEVFNFFHVPRIWSLRPRWTNNTAISLATYGVDTILPNNTSLQIGALYDQDTIFSSRFDIFITEHGKKQHTRQIAGFCSRRLLLSQLMMSCSALGRFFVHPNFSPVQVAIIFQKKSFDADKVKNLFGRIGQAVRYVFDVCDSSHKAAQLQKNYQDKGVPLIVLIQDKRQDHDEYNIVFQRGDNRQEAQIRIDDIDGSICDLMSVALFEIGAFADNKLNDYFNAQFSNDVVKIIPLAYEENAVRQVEKSIKGEIIGFIVADDKQKCAVTQQDVLTRAVLCRRF